MKIFKGDKNDKKDQEKKKIIISMLINFAVFEAFWFAFLYLTLPKLLG